MNNLYIQKLTPLISEYIKDFQRMQSEEYVVKPSIPIVWFGDMEKYLNSEKKVITVALNPSYKEFEENRFDIIDFNSEDVTKNLIKTLNQYFTKKEYKKFFGHFENILSVFNSSYYEKTKNTAIHLDSYSAIATKPTWGKLNENQKNKLKQTDLFKKLVNLLDPNIIIFSASKKVFNNIFAENFCYENGKEDINGKKGFFIKKYRHKDKDCILISGRNFNGAPFGGITFEKARLICKELIDSLI